MSLRSLTFQPTQISLRSLEKQKEETEQNFLLPTGFQTQIVPPPKKSTQFLCSLRTKTFTTLLVFFVILFVILVVFICALFAPIIGVSSINSTREASLRYLRTVFEDLNALKGSSTFLGLFHPRHNVFSSELQLLPPLSLTKWNPFPFFLHLNKNKNFSITFSPHILQDSFHLNPSMAFSFGTQMVHFFFHFNSEIPLFNSIPTFLLTFSNSHQNIQ